MSIRWTRFGANVDATLAAAPTSIFSAAVTFDVTADLWAPARTGEGASLSIEFDLDGAADDQAYPGYIAAADDESFTLDFTFDPAPAGGFIWPFEFDTGPDVVAAEPGAQALGELTDVDLSTPPTNGQSLVYRIADQKWAPADVSGGGEGGGPISSTDVTTALGYTPTSVTGLTGIQSVSAFKTGLTLVKADVGLGNAENKSSATIRGELTSSNVTTALTYTPSSVTGLEGVKSVSAFKTGLSLVKGDVGLGNVDNTTDVGKPVSTAQQTALDLKQDALGYVPTSVTTLTGVQSVSAFKTGLTLIAADVGLGSVDNKSSATIRGEITSSNVTTALTYTPTSVTGLTGVQSVAAFKTGLTLTKSDIGLGNVDNTTDLGKPISTLTQTALDLKQDALGYVPTSVTSLTGVQSVSAFKTGLSLVAGDVGLGSVENKSSATIRGELTTANVTTALTYTPTSVTGLTGVQSTAAFKTGLSLVKGDVGLGNVDNTTDLGKPISTLTQTALDLKQNVLTKADQATAEAGTDDTDYMTALKTAQAIAALGAGDEGPITSTEVTDALGYTPTSVTGLEGVQSVADFKTGLTLAKADVGLGSVENKSAATILGELTSGEIETALGFTPVDAATINAANGVAGLDGSGKISTTILPDSVLGALDYQGTWNATTNSPTIPAAASGNKGWYYIVATAGTTSEGGITDWKVGDWIVSDGAAWDKIDNTDSVTSVAGLTGAPTAGDLKTAMSLDSVENKSAATILGELTSSNVTGALTYTPTSVTGLTGVKSIADFKTGLTLVKGDVGLGNVENKSAATILGELTSGEVEDALGFTPISGIDSAAVTTALTYTPTSVTGLTGVQSVAAFKTGLSLVAGDVGLGSVDNKSSATIRGEITSANVTDALTYTPTSVTGLEGVQSVAAFKTGLTLAKADVGLGSVENKSAVTILGELTSTQVETALGFTPIAGIDSSAVTTALTYTPLNKAGDTMSGALTLADTTNTLLFHTTSTTGHSLMKWDVLGNARWQFGRANGPGGEAGANAGSDFYLYRYDDSGVALDAGHPSMMVSRATGVVAFDQVPTAGGYNLLTGITSSQVTTALGYTPANLAGDTFLGNITLKSSGAAYMWWNTSAGANAKRAYVDKTLTGLEYVFQSDDALTALTWQTVTGTSAGVTSIAYVATAMTLNGSNILTASNKAAGSDVLTGTDDAKFVTSKALLDATAVIAKGNSGTTAQTFTAAATSTVQTITVTGAHTWTFSMRASGYSELEIIATNPAAFTVTLPTVHWIKGDGTASTTFSSMGVTLQASGVNHFLIWSPDGGTTLYGRVI